MAIFDWNGDGKRIYGTPQLNMKSISKSWVMTMKMIPIPPMTKMMISKNN